jgi:hypothetical protein
MPTPNTSPIPNTIPQLWVLIDHRLTVLEEKGCAHQILHELITEDLKDHEQRIRQAGTPGIIAATVNSMISVIAIIKAFFSG